MIGLLGLGIDLASLSADHSSNAHSAVLVHNRIENYANTAQTRAVAGDIGTSSSFR